MIVQITSLYAALLALVYMVLFGMIGATRTRVNLSLGDGGKREMIIANRRHMNFVENVPMALLLIGLLEATGVSKTMIHSLGLVLLAARIIHPFGIDPDIMNRPARIIGAGATALVILVSAGVLLWRYVTLI